MKPRIKSSDILLLLISVVITLLVSILLIRWLAPTLLGVPADMVLLRSSEEIPPYYENIFRKEHWESNEFIMKDPLVRVRAKPFYPDIGGMGPNDLLGFRNLAVPNEADVIVIGDSQTYGNNVSIYENFPHVLEDNLVGVSIYSMATGGWAALQYYYAFLKSPVFTPKVVVIAFYTGNDPLETFMLAAASELWKEFLPAEDIERDTAPSAEFPAPVAQQWQHTFSDGIETIFTSKLRHTSNMKHPAVDAGYEIMSNVARAISNKAKEYGISIVFTIIPTKEYVYSDKVKAESVLAPSDYLSLVQDESERINAFSKVLSQLPAAYYVDVAEALKLAALTSTPLYPTGMNGHPMAAGYAVIAETLTPKLKKLIVSQKEGVVVRVTAENNQVPLYLKQDQYWLIKGGHEEITKLVVASGSRVVKGRELAGFKYMGHRDVEGISVELRLKSK